MSEVIPSTSFESLLLRRNGMLEKIGQARALCLEADSMSEGLCNTASALTGSTYQRELCITAPEVEETVRKRIDAAGWDFLMIESGMRTFMDTAARDEWNKKIRDCDVPELTMENIEATFASLHGSRGDMFERGVVNVFRKLSWHYQTNQPQKFGKRIILSYIGAMGFSMNHEKQAQIDDLGRVFHVLDNKPELDHRVGYGVGFSDALRGRTGKYDCAYFSARLFRKGTAHLTFKRPELVEKMNLIVAKHYPGCLPEPK